MATKKQRAVIPVVHRRPGEMIASDLVMWAIVDDSSMPAFLALKRDHARIVLDALPEVMRADLQILRTYVTIQAIESRGRPPRRVA